MRRILVWVGIGLIAACSSFGSAADPATGGSGGAADAGNDGRDPVTGEPADDSFILNASPLPLVILPGGSARLTVTVKRGKQVQDPITARIRGLPTGFAAPPINIPSDIGELALSAGPAIGAGAIAATIEASVAGSDVPVTLAVDVLVPGAPGSPDPSWPQISIPGLPGGVAVAVDGSLFAASSCLDGTDFNVCVAHFTANGALDSAYGTAGVARFVQREPRQILVQPDNNVLVGGNSNGNFAWVSRLTRAGTPDGSFGASGMLLVNASTTIDALALRPDGNLFVAYGSGSISRFDSNGSPISAFNGGAVITSDGITQGMALRATGSPPALAILSEDGSHNVLFVEVSSDTGAPTPGQSLGSPKRLAVPGISFNSTPAGVAALPDGSIIAPFLGDGGLYLVKLNALGDPATGFGTNGVSGPYPVEAGDLGTPTGIAIQDDGKILVALMDGTLLRFTPTPALDITFGGGNGVTGSTGTTSRQRVVVQNPARIVVTTLTASGDTQLAAYWQ